MIWSIPHAAKQRWKTENPGMTAREESQQGQGKQACSIHASCRREKKSLTHGHAKLRALKKNASASTPSTLSMIWSYLLFHIPNKKSFGKF